MDGDLSGLGHFIEVMISDWSIFWLSMKLRSDVFKLLPIFDIIARAILEPEILSLGSHISFKLLLVMHIFDVFIGSHKGLFDGLLLREFSQSGPAGVGFADNERGLHGSFRPYFHLSLIIHV